MQASGGKIAGQLAACTRGRSVDSGLRAQAMSMIYTLTPSVIMQHLSDHNSSIMSEPVRTSTLAVIPALTQQLPITNTWG